MNGEADFGVFQAEEISYATQWDDYLSITNEIRIFEDGMYYLLTLLYIIYNYIINMIIFKIYTIFTRLTTYTLKMVCSLFAIFQFANTQFFDQKTSF